MHLSIDLATEELQGNLNLKLKINKIKLPSLKPDTNEDPSFSKYIFPHCDTSS